MFCKNALILRFRVRLILTREIFFIFDGCVYSLLECILFLWTIRKTFGRLYFSVLRNILRIEDVFIVILLHEACIQ